MGTRTREERVQRQRFDDGDPDDTVYLKIGGSGGNAAHTYHEDEDCDGLSRANDKVEKTRSTAQRAWKQPCARCVISPAEEEPEMPSSAD